VRPLYYVCKLVVPAAVVAAGLVLILSLDTPWYVDGLIGLAFGYLSAGAQEWAMERERRYFWKSL